MFKNLNNPWEPISRAFLPVTLAILLVAIIQLAKELHNQQKNRDGKTYYDKANRCLSKAMDYGAHGNRMMHDLYADSAMLYTDSANLAVK